MKQLNSIQALRGIAAFGVFCCHLISIEQSVSGRPAKLTGLADSGAFGVDLFFVISGFVMVWVAAELPRGWRSARAFLIARIVRIYPLWWMFAGLAAIGYVLLYHVPWDAPRVAGMDISGPSHLLHSLALWPQPGHPVLGAGWTLVHEMYFYVGFTILILLTPIHYRLRVLLGWGIAVSIGALNGLSTGFASNVLGLIFHPMMLQFLFGAAIAYAVKRDILHRARLAVCVGILLLLIGMTRLDIAVYQGVSDLIGAAPIPAETLPWRRTLLIGSAAGALVYGLVSLERAPSKALTLPKPLTRLGDWSYSLYLCHMLTISVAARATYAVMDAASPWSIAVFLIAATSLTLATAWLSFEFVERPLIAYFKRHRGAPSKPQMSSQALA